jgi:hypothetical protein
MACVGCPLVLVGTLTPPLGKVPEVYVVPLIVILVALVGNALMRMLVIVPLAGSVAPKVAAGTVTLVVPPGFVWLAALNVLGVAVCSIPKLTPVIFTVATLIAVTPFTVPSPAAAVPSPVFTHPEGREVAGAGKPIVPAVVLNNTV